MLRLADIAPESVLLAGAGRAILLQIAYPAIGYGVARHSDFANRPMDRLNATLSYIYALASGSDDDVRLMRRAVNRAHAGVRNPPRPTSSSASGGADAPEGRMEPSSNAPPPETNAAGDVDVVRGPRVAGDLDDADVARDPHAAGDAQGAHDADAAGDAQGAHDADAAGDADAPGAPDTAGDVGVASATAGTAHPNDPLYDAYDPHLQLWVAATLYDTALTVYQTVYGPLDEASADHVYLEYARLGTTLQMPAELWPADRAAFRAYWNETLATLRVDDTIRGVADALLRAEKAPLPIRMAMPVARLVTVALLPESVRREYRFAWSPRRDRKFVRLVRFGAPVYRMLPRPLRRWPQRHYVSRIRTDYA
ncbi:oxygenase MpaB family protein [Herbiconiux sp. UC225_62]|uniref:oxygenase MpaB family protein n=1 Tax=Herbiconiux sp. UC225_62 TaxID=3350168 RepID=UPI0036D3B7C3